MFKHSATCVKEIYQKTLTIKIPFYPIYVNDYKVESWHTRAGELVIIMSEKPKEEEKPTSIQECYEYSRYPGERS